MAFHFTWDFVFGLLGNILGFLISCLSSMPTSYQIWKKKTSQGFNSIPHVVSQFSAMIWLLYALSKNDATLLITINSFSFFMDTAYIALYFFYATREDRIFTIKLVLLFNVFGFGTICILAMFLTDGENRVKHLGVICLIFAILVFVAALAIVTKAIRIKSVKFMPLTLSIFLTVNAVMWFFYGFLNKDYFVAIPNILGFIVGILQMVLYMIYRNPKKSVEEPKVDELSLQDIHKQAQVVTEATSQYSLSNNQDHKQAEINLPAPLQLSEIIQINPVQDLISPVPGDQNQTPMISSGDVHIEVDSVTGESPPTTSKITADWAFLITSLVIEGASAVFDQLNYLLPSMVLAFAALFVSAVDLIYVAQRERLIKQSGCLRCFYCRLINDNSPTSERFIIVNGYGLTSALWLCLYSTFQYIYGHRHLNNPIRMTLLPFVFLLCVLISKSTRLRRKMEEINCQDFNRSRAKIEPQSHPNQSAEACLSLMEQRDAVDANVSAIISEFGAEEYENGGKACAGEEDQ